MPGWLKVVFDDATVSRLLIVSPNGTEVLFQDIRGSAKLTSDQIEFDGVHVSAPGWAIAGASGNLYAHDPVALEVNTAWSLTDDHRVAGIAHAVGDLDRFLVDARVAAPGTGHIQAEVRNVRSELTWRGQAEIEKLDLAQWTGNPPFGPLRATLAIAGDRSHYTASVVHGNGLPESGVPVDAKAGTLTASSHSNPSRFETGPPRSSAGAGHDDGWRIFPTTCRLPDGIRGPTGDALAFRRGSLGQRWTESAFASTQNSSRWGRHSPAMLRVVSRRNRRRRIGPAGPRRRVAFAVRGPMNEEVRLRPRCDIDRRNSGAAGPAPSDSRAGRASRRRPLVRKHPKTVGDFAVSGRAAAAACGRKGQFEFRMSRSRRACPPGRRHLGRDAHLDARLVSEDLSAFSRTRRT
jgi:hypothetical protein